MKTNNVKEKNLPMLLIAVVAALAVVGCVVLMFLNKRANDNLAAVEEMMAFEKEQLESEYQDLAIQYDGYQINLSNDSLMNLLDQEKQHVQDLLEELRITKATDARKIAALKKELATVRAVMVEYVHQIDSLSHQNKRLVAENQQVRQQYQEVAQQAQQLTQEKTALTEKVQRASMMEVSKVEVLMLNKRDRTTKLFGQLQKLQINFSVLKNITTAPGSKTVYLQIRQPNGEVLVKSIHNVFNYENKQIEYSLKKEFDYEGEEVAMTLYWTVEEVLEKGLYNADFFIDGNLVGSFPFALN